MKAIFIADANNSVVKVISLYHGAEPVADLPEGQFAVEVDGIPAPEIPMGKIAILCVDQVTHELSFQFEDAPPTMEQKISQLEKDNINLMLSLTTMQEESINNMLAITELYEMIIGGN